MNGTDEDLIKAGAEIIGSAVKEIAKDVYEDGGKPVLKPTAQCFGLIPRAIKAAFLPMEQWILKKEYNLAETEAILQEKLQNVKPENIVSPEPHIAVPALQYISYCMDNKELREMYANLLANSMNKVVKDGVHPSFVEIIKQLSPDEAKILKEMQKEKYEYPIISLWYRNKENNGVEVVRFFSNIVEKCGCEKFENFQEYFDNLQRLGLISISMTEWFIDEEIYKSLEEHTYIAKFMVIPDLHLKSGYIKTDIKRGVITTTGFGKAFCSICF